MSPELAGREHSAHSGRRRSRRRSASQRLFRRISKRRIGQVVLVIALGLVSIAAAYWVSQRDTGRSSSSLGD